LGLNIEKVRQMIKIDLSGKVAIVTGGASGIGKAISKTLAECGAKVCIADINIKEAEKTASEIGQNSIAIKTDVSSSESVKEMVEKVISNFEKIDTLINNAGWDEIKFFLDTDPVFWEKISKSL
jgi:2-hydroxycyclohexanecarboxyl-CoA dehydrogenase